MIIASSIWLLLGLVLGTAYSTLSERYVMATVQRRIGPDYLLFGLVQPLIDGIKLIAKNFTSVYRIWDSIYYIFVGLLLTLGLGIWSLLVYDGWTHIINIEYSILFILVITSVGVYTIVLSGMSGCCRYSLLGVFRFLMQLISYEVNFSILILAIFGYYLGFHCSAITSVSIAHVPGLTYIWLLVYLIILGMIETARVPFDLPESESELVSGYNTEYGSFLFALLFLGEYSSILVFAGLILLFVGGSISPVHKLLMVAILATIIIASRCLYARLRYYDVVTLGWIHLLWFGMSILFLVISVFVL